MIIRKIWLLTVDSGKSVAQKPAEGNIVGCDFAGIVEELGPETQTDLKVGDRIAGFVHGCAYTYRLSAYDHY